MAPSPQSRFIEGSMNDRASNAPPPGYLGAAAAEDTAEYERQFALDWRAPDASSPRPGNRSSVVSIGSAASPTSPRSATWSKGQKPAGSSSSTSGFLAPLWGGVKERLSLTRSKSSNTITSEKHSSDDGSSSIFILPTFKHKRSESTNTAQILRANDSSRQLDTKSLHHGSETPKLKKAPSAATLPIGGVNAPNRFDPATRPTREEIQANYQSLLASGFFGNRAIQSTRFSAPGQNQNRPNPPVSPSFAHRISEDGQEQQEEGEALSPPPPQRQPPPPPLIRTAANPPDLSILTDMMSQSSSSGGIQASETVVWSPVPKDPEVTSDMLPPPPSPPKHKKSRHKPSLSLTSVFSSARSVNEPSESRLFRSPPPSHAKYSLDSGRRSSDGQRNVVSKQQRGVKRPFTAANVSDLSLAGRVYYGLIGGGESDTGVTAAQETGHESGARKFVKKIRKSASRLSMDLGKTMSRPASVFGYESDANNSGMLSPTREPLSAVIKRSFDWRGGKSGPEEPTTGTNGNYENSDSNNHRSGNRTDNARSRATSPAPKSTTGRFLAPSLSVITGSPASPERNKLKKKEIHGRRLRRQDSNNSPSKATHQAPVPSPTQDRATTTMEYTMDWQTGQVRPTHQAGNNQRQSRSRSRSRPRRSPTAIFMHNQSRPGTAHSTDSFLSSTSNKNYHHQNDVASFSFGSPVQPHRSAEMNNATPVSTDYMEGVEFAAPPSYHFPGRVRPGVPLAIVPDANRGIPSVPSIPGEFRNAKITTNGRGENSSGMDAMAIDGNGSAWSSPQALF
ncbi:hypothetical protein VMCG_05455 [Cytospora schulzeri]|uniref:Uncharacterized protein n=1 Tax=Cytospora schulzeri TaxID=448051 RepID=A0A423WK25_9PEZI|nr:hypothetical protein VMCG_05455 [Valsa malicola]